MQAKKAVGRRSRDGLGRGKVAAKKERLNRQAIAEAALALIDREGLEALSFRRLGQELGCEAMSLYHYLPSKAHLLDAIVDLVFGQLLVTPPGPPWVERLRQSAWNYRAMALAHPKLFPLIAVHRMNTPTGVKKLDEIIAVFREAGFDDATAARLFREMGYYLVGAALDETAGYAKGPSAAVPVTEEQIARDCPSLAAAAPYFRPQYFEETFRCGLEILLQGMERLKAAK